ncbi:hypothetical protein LN449_09130 [Xanthomonas cannabis]|uniref:hypothetical protein n=1 Tax=Xanthomonas cannabis TaxID=1885674 RepID=UPI001E3A6F70|nr:hypothetical protein [Xanthomonas cannabis]MCC8442675.1 hypothetical protein [Xanthomonas cannabis]
MRGSQRLSSLCWLQSKTCAMQLARCAGFCASSQRFPRGRIDALQLLSLGRLARHCLALSLHWVMQRSPAVGPLKRVEVALGSSGVGSANGTGAVGGGA